MNHEAGIDRAFVVDLLNDLVATNSVNPTLGKGPGEAALSELIYDRLAPMENLDIARQSVADGRANVIAILKGTGSGHALILNGHMDTVGIDGMAIEPFKPFAENGRVHGRGACDMKGALAAMIGSIKSLADSGSKLKGDLIFTGVVDEEHKSLGTKKLVEEYKADAAIVGEPTGNKIATAHKGFVWVEIETKGKAAHGSVPEKGVDAIAHAAKIVSALEILQRNLESRTHGLLGSPRIHTSTIEGGTDWSIVPERCMVRLERRTLPGETTAAVMEEIQGILRNIGRENKDFHAAARDAYEMPPLETVASEPIVLHLRQAVADTIGRSDPLIGVPYWTDGALLSALGAIPTCVFGPGDIGVAHSADEYVTIDEVFSAAEVYREIALRFCGQAL